MKRIITFVMILIMTVVSFSSHAEPGFTGVWSTVRNLDDSITEVVVLRVFSDQIVYYSRQQFTENSIGEEEKAFYTWEQDNDRSFRMIDSASEEIGYFSLIGNDRLLAYSDMFARVDFYARETPTPNPEPEQSIDQPEVLSEKENNYLGSWVMYAVKDGITYLYTITFFEDMHVVLKSVKFSGSSIVSDNKASGEWIGYTPETVILSLAGEDYVAGIRSDGLLGLYDYDKKNAAAFFSRCSDLSYVLK